VLALAAAWGIIAWIYRGRWADGAGSAAAADPEAEAPFNAHQTRKGLLVTGVVMVLFFTPIPREFTALAAAGWLLCSRRMTTRSILGLVDWHLITLFCALFIVIHGLARTGAPERAMAFLAGHGVALDQPGTLTAVSTVLSNLVSNVPAAMLLVRFLDPLQPVQWYILAVSSTFAGNLLVIGSIANLIVFEQARAFGIVVRAREHARTGIPVTLASLAILLLWVWLAGGFAAGQ
jgi:Na+/H+ antiporter NhaD/arsenite permease-like protein